MNKICILLSGLQRNCEPFIENQLNFVINKYNLDVFIFTSDENSYRYFTNSKIEYCKKENYDIDETFFKNKYKNLISIYIDNNNAKFDEFISKNNINKKRNHTLNMISSYFKVNECIKLMEEYECKNNFKYDLVLRCRLDFFAFDDFLDITKVDTNIIYLPQSKFNNHKDDSGILMNREYIEYFKKFINIPISFEDEHSYINIEGELHNYLNKKYKICFTNNLTYRIGVGCKVLNIPYYNNSSCKNKLFTLEYKSDLEN